MLIPALLLVCAVILELLFFFLGSVPNHSAGVVQAIQLQFQTHIVYLVSVYLLLRRPLHNWKWMILIAIVFRLTLWIAYPMLSDDVYRYRWEGRLQALGGNPYQVRPNDPAWAKVRDSTFPDVGSKDFKAGYGPLIELEQLWMYRAVSRFTSNPFVQVFWYKLPAAICDLLLLWVLLRLLSRHGLPPSYILLYAWCPTSIVEFWWNGHNDAIPLLFV